MSTFEQLQKQAQADAKSTVSDTNASGDGSNGGIMHGIFLNWNKKDGDGKFSQPTGLTEAPPKYTTQGKALLLECQIVMTRCAPSEVFKPIFDDNGNIVAYNVRCRVSFSKDNGKSSRDAKAFLLKHSAEAYDSESTMDPQMREHICELTTKDGQIRAEGPKAVTYVWRRFEPNQFINCTFMAFEQRPISTDLLRRTPDNMYPIRQMVPVKLNAAEGAVSVSVFQPKAEGTPLVLSVRQANIKFMSVDNESTQAIGNVGPLFHKWAAKNIFPWQPMEKVIERTAEFPGVVMFEYLGDSEMHGGAVARIQQTSDDPENFTWGEEHKTRRFWYFRDVYMMLDGQPYYTIKLKAWPDVCDSFGIDPQMWGVLMSANQYIPFRAMIKPSWKDTMKMGGNYLDALKTRAPGTAEGTYSCNVSMIRPDYQLYFVEQEQGLELTADDVLELFTTANKDSPEIFETGKRTIMNAIPERVFNPLHFNGIRSPVLCLGSANRPTLDCRKDLSFLFTNTGNRFFALLEDKAQSKEDFLARALAGLKYQIFVIQNFDGTGEKKHV